MTTNKISFTECMVFVSLAVVIGYSVGKLIETLDTAHYIRPSQLNDITSSQVEEMKQQCEATIPRNKSCVAVLTFLPEVGVETKTTK
jgi:hypothetical protein